MTKNVLDTALDAEMTEHLGYDKHVPAGRGSGNPRNGVRSKTVLTEIGPVDIDVPRDVNSSFDQQIVKKRQRRLTGIDEIVLPLTAKGLTTGEIAAHFQDIYGATVSKDTISRITDKVVAEMAEWCNRPLEPVYPVVFVRGHEKVPTGGQVEVSTLGRIKVSTPRSSCRSGTADDCARRMFPGVLTEIPHLMAGSVYRLAGAGGGSSEGVCGGVVVA